MKYGLLLLLALLPCAPAAAEDVAVVVGHNTPLPGSGYPALQYADDDALRTAELLMALGVRVTLLTTPDAETARRMPTLAGMARPPTRAAVREALRDAAKVGPKDTVWIYFSGHGSMSGANAWLHLADGRMTRGELRRWGQPTADAAGRVHLIIDACHSWFLVNARGGRVVATPEDDTLLSWNRAGFLLSTSQRKEVHEWAAYRGGVFTHLLLGALRGAADVNADGTVSYGEAHAYLVAANLGVSDVRARIEPFVKAPLVGPAALTTWTPSALSRRAQIPSALNGRLFIDDARGERVLDAHKAAGAPLNVWLPLSERVVLHRGAEQWSLNQVGRFERNLNADETVNSRGLVSDALRADLFARPLSVDFVAGFEAGHGVQAPPAAVVQPAFVWHEDPWTLGLLTSAGASLAAAGVLTPMYLGARDEADKRPITDDTEAAGRRATQLQAGMAATWATGGALLAAATLRIVLSSD
jgi:hypothetical protein